MNQELREKLLAMRKADEQAREELARTGELFEGYCPKMEKVHLENAAALEHMINENGWLGKSLVGSDGAEVAWLIVQHAISLPEFLRKCLKLIEKAVTENEAEPYQYAYLYDRIAAFENRPQKYGTQSDWNESGMMEVWKLEDAGKVNEYRARVGLKPLESLTWKNKDARENKPVDFAARRAEFEAWAKQVGWRK
jgi:hypothetical protein